MRTIARKPLGALAALVGLIICFGATTYAQDDESKGIQAEEYVKKRPKAAFNGSGTRNDQRPRPASKRRVYRPVKNDRRSSTAQRKEAAKATEIADVGFTLWRFGRVLESDDPKALRELDPRTRTDIVGRRLGSESRLAVGDIVRISIESGSHEGYLYVINREKFRDGTFGVPRLIFPTSTRWSGRNLVKPGVLMYLPSSEGFIEVTTETATKQDAEELIVIISPTELIDPERFRSGSAELSEADVAQWINKWGAEATKMELDDAVGETMTVAEREAGEQQKSAGEERKGLRSLLTEVDAAPQTVLRMRIKPGDPILARFELKVGAQ